MADEITTLDTALADALAAYATITAAIAAEPRAGMIQRQLAQAVVKTLAPILRQAEPLFAYQASTLGSPASVVAGKSGYVELAGF